MKSFNKILFTLLAMGGIFVDKFTPLRFLSYIVFGFLILAYNWLGKNVTGELAIVIFSFSILIRYTFLFNSFKRNGIADWLKNKFGDPKGFEYYQFMTSIMFFLSALNFTLVLNKTSLYNYDQISGMKFFFTIIGGIGIVVGFVINIWSAMLIGIDIYYYKDLFLGRPIGGIIKKGPYKYLSNPLYGVGQINGYGTALMYGSIVGILLMILNQILIFTFFNKVEKPHIIKCFKEISNDLNPQV